MMRLVLSLLALVVTLAFSAASRAQSTGNYWVQIEAQALLVDAEDRATAWQGIFKNVVGFSTDSGWYVIVLGPYKEAEAEARRAKLSAENLIPYDSFVSNGSDYGNMFWPTGSVNSLTLPKTDLLAQDTLPPDPVLTEDIGSKPDQPIVAADDPPKARDSEALLSKNEREELQRGLIWFGFYNGTVDGAFGSGTRASIAAWQEANRYEKTGILTAEQRQVLIAAYRAEELGFDFQKVTESEAGIEASLPLAIVTFDHYEPPFVHFIAKDGSDTRIFLISKPGDQTTLQSLYDALQTLQIMPADGPRSLTNDSFNLRGESSDRITQAFATTSHGMVKGWLISWNPQSTPNMERVVSTLKTSFRPIGDHALDPSLVLLTPGVKNGLLAGLEIKKPRLSRTGFYVDTTGSVLTTNEAINECARITLDNRTKATVVATDPASGLALLKPAIRLAPPQVASFTAGIPGTEIAVSGYSYGDTLPAPVMTFGSFAASEGIDPKTTLNRLNLTALSGDSGGPVLTATGAVVGALLPKSTRERILPKGVEFAVPASVILPFLQRVGITANTNDSTTPLTPQDQATLATAMTVLVSCWD